MPTPALTLSSIQFSYLDSEPYMKLPYIIDSYFQLVHKLYQCGARRFLILNVPPTTRTPKMLALPEWQREIHSKAVYQFNQRLGGRVKELHQLYHDVCRDSCIFPMVSLIAFQASVQVYDVWSFMTDILDSPEEYGFLDNRCIGEGCIWWDGYHPRSAFHQLLAADIQTNLSKRFWLEVDRKKEFLNN